MAWESPRMMALIKWQTHRQWGKGRGSGGGRGRRSGRASGIAKLPRLVKLNANGQNELQCKQVTGRELLLRTDAASCPLWQVANAATTTTATTSEGHLQWPKRNFSLSRIRFAQVFTCIHSIDLVYSPLFCAACKFTKKCTQVSSCFCFSLDLFFVYSPRTAHKNDNKLPSYLICLLHFVYIFSLSLALTLYLWIRVNSGFSRCQQLRATHATCNQPFETRL